MSNLSETETVRLNELMTQFDFEKVHHCMTLLNWTWFGATSDNGIPTLEDLQRESKRLITDVIINYLRNNTSGSVGTGGFQVLYNHFQDYIEIKFVLTEWMDDYILGEDIYKTALKSEKRKKVVKKLLDGTKE